MPNKYDLTPAEKQKRKLFRSLSSKQQEAFINALSPEQAIEMRYNPIYWLRDKQIVPEGNYRICLVKSGRGFGKTYMAASFIKRLVDLHPGKKNFIALVCPTIRDISSVFMPELLGVFPPNEQPHYSEQKGLIEFKNGCTALTFSSDKQIRGVNVDYIVLDEMVAFCEGNAKKIEECFKVLNLGCRKNDAKIIITSTPKPFPIFKQWQQRFLAGDKKIIIVSGSTTENKHLSQDAVDSFYAEYGGSRFAREELEGEILTDTQGAMWTPEMFERNRIEGDPPSMRQIVIGVDPAVSNTETSDATGIVVVGYGFDGHCYILDDATNKYSPLGWAQKVVYLYDKWQADLIIAEKNMGGDLVDANIRTVRQNAPVKLVSASKGKVARAQPVASFNDRNKLHCVGYFPRLEDQCCSYSGDPKEKSPDALDAMVWAVSYFLDLKTVSRQIENIPFY